MDQYPIEETVLPEVEQQAVPACQGCGGVVQMTTTRGNIALCHNCHAYFLKYPIPRWMKLFGAGVLALLVLSFIQLPSTISTGIHFNRGQKAAAQHRFYTAQKEFARVVDKEPGYTEAQVRLAMAAFYNGDYITLSNVGNSIRDRVVDQSIQDEADKVLLHFSSYVPSDSFAVWIQQYNNNVSQVPATEFEKYISANPEDHYAATAYASALLGADQYRKADSLLQYELDFDPSLLPALYLKIPVKRDLGQADSALYYADRVLAINKEDIYALSAKARVLLKVKRDAEAEQAVSQALALNSSDVHAQLTMSLVHHYKGATARRDALLAKLAADTANTDQVQFVRDIISGKEIFRN